MFDYLGFLFCFVCFCLFLQNSSISWLLPYLFGTVPQSYLRGCLPGYSPQLGPRIKHNSRLLGCAFFSVESIMTLSHFLATKQSGVGGYYYHPL